MPETASQPTTALDSRPVLKSLTPKQNRFCRNVASGMSQSDAYRDAYDASNMQDTSIHVESSKLMARPNIQQRVSQLNAEKDRAVVYSALSDRERVLDSLRKVASGEMLMDPVQLRAVELLGKASGVFDRGQDGDRVPKSSEAILQDIRDRLSRMLESKTIDPSPFTEGEAIDAEFREMAESTGKDDRQILEELQGSESLPEETTPGQGHPPCQE